MSFPNWNNCCVCVSTTLCVPWKVQRRGTSKRIMYLNVPVCESIVCVWVCMTQILSWLCVVYLSICPQKNSHHGLVKNAWLSSLFLPKIIPYSIFRTASLSSSNLRVPDMCDVCLFIFAIVKSVIFYWEMSAGVWGLELREEKRRG